MWKGTCKKNYEWRWGIFFKRNPKAFQIRSLLVSWDGFPCKLLTQMFSGHMPCKSFYLRFNLAHLSRFPKPCDCLEDDTPLHMLWCHDRAIVQARNSLDWATRGDTFFSNFLDFIPELREFLREIVNILHAKGRAWGRR